MGIWQHNISNSPPKYLGNFTENNFVNNNTEKYLIKKNVLHKPKWTDPEGQTKTLLPVDFIKIISSFLGCFDQQYEKNS